MAKEISNLQKGRAKSGPKSNTPLITFNQKYGRMYFSAKAVEILDLQNVGFQLIQDEGSWKMKLSPGTLIKLKTHQYATYVCDRKLVRTIYSSLELNGKDLVFEISVKAIKNNLIPLIKKEVKQQAGVKKKNYKVTLLHSFPEDIAIDKKYNDKLIKANRIITTFKSASCNKEKTQEVLKAERLIFHANFQCY